MGCDLPPRARRDRQGLGRSGLPDCWRRGVAVALGEAGTEEGSLTHASRSFLLDAELRYRRIRGRLEASARFAKLLSSTRLQAPGVMPMWCDVRSRPSFSDRGFNSSPSSDLIPRSCLMQSSTNDSHRTQRAAFCADVSSTVCFECRAPGREAAPGRYVPGQPGTGRSQKEESEP